MFNVSDNYCLLYDDPDGMKELLRIQLIEWHKSVGGWMYLKKANAWADAYYKSPHHKYVMVFIGCHLHGCQMCFDLSPMNTHLNKYMGDLL